MKTTATCKECRGRGWQNPFHGYWHSCAVCNGTGRTVILVNDEARSPLLIAAMVLTLIAVGALGLLAWGNL